MSQQGLGGKQFGSSNSLLFILYNSKTNVVILNLKINFLFWESA